MGSRPRTLDHAFLSLMSRAVVRDGCWIKQWAKVRPKIMVNGTRYPAPRVVLSVLEDLDIEDRGWLACHLCSNPRCFNPRHLYVGDRSSNATDGVVMDD